MKKKKILKKILIIFALIILLILIVFGAYKAYNYIDMELKFKKFETTQPVSTKGVLQYDKTQNVAEVQNMDYVIQNEIGVKVDSLKITDTTFEANISFNIKQDFEHKTFGYSYIVYDENNNIYGVQSRMHVGKKEKYDYGTIFMKRERGIDILKNHETKTDLSDRTGISTLEINENDENISNTITLEATDKFPLSQKIYIEILDLGYYNINKIDDQKISAQNFKLTDSKWLFEFDIPDEMNERESINLKLKDEIPGIEVTDITLTDTKLVLNFNSQEYIDLISSGKDMPSNEFLTKCKEMLNITDSEGNIYQEIGGGTTSDEYGYKVSFDINLNDLSKKLFINFKVNDIQYKSELIK